MLIAILVVGWVLGYIAVLVGFVGAMGRAHADMYEGRSIEDPGLLAPIDRECDVLRVELEAISARGAERVRQENTAVERFVERVEATTSAEDRADDPPTDDWLDDWLRPVAARDRYARALDRNASASLAATPQEGDEPITTRMKSAWAGCGVPLAIRDDLAP